MSRFWRISANRAIAYTDEEDAMRAFHAMRETLGVRCILHKPSCIFCMYTHKREEEQDWLSLTDRGPTKRFRVFAVVQLADAEVTEDELKQHYMDVLEYRPSNCSDEFMRWRFAKLTEQECADFVANMAVWRDSSQTFISCM